MAAQELSPVRAQALFDILSHHESYAEIENFKHPDATRTYGPPFVNDKATQSTSPILQTLVSKFILALPGLRDATQDFWQQRCQGLIEALQAAELSESYDKGRIGIRKTLSTAASAIVEYPARGSLGGLSKGKLNNPEGHYDLSKADDLQGAWGDFLQQLVYGSLVDDLFAKAAETYRLKDHPSVIQAAHEYVVINIASAFHFVFVLHPKGQTLLALIERVHKQVPYGLIKQTLKVGNVATMISGMTRLFLAKLSLNAVTNWMGISNASDDGMNLLQQIISTILTRDIADLRARATRIEEASDTPSEEQRNALKDYLHKSRKDHDQCREESREQSKSIVKVILSKASVSTDMSKQQHSNALEYLAIILSIRDREEISRVLCHHQPDLLTQFIKDLVAAYEPIIRSVHNAVDLSATVADAESFVNDLINIAKLGETGHDRRDGQSHVATVQDFRQLLLKHQSSSHRFLHEVAKNGPDVTKTWHDYALRAVSQFKQSEAENANGDRESESAESSVITSLQSLYSKLSEKERDTVLQQVDAHAEYLKQVRLASSNRLASMLGEPGKSTSTTLGPGTYVAKWQSLLDATVITPATMEGNVQYESSDSVKDAASIDVDGKKKGAMGASGSTKSEKESSSFQAPDVSEVVRLLGAGFRELLAGHRK